MREKLYNYILRTFMGQKSTKRSLHERASPPPKKKPGKKMTRKKGRPIHSHPPPPSHNVMCKNLMSAQQKKSE